MLRTTENQNAIARAQAKKCRVLALPRRTYLVLTPKGHRYSVRMLIQNGERYALCNCRAARFERACVHVVHAANVDDLRFDGRALAA